MNKLDYMITLLFNKFNRSQMNHNRFSQLRTFDLVQ